MRSFIYLSCLVPCRIGYLFTPGRISRFTPKIEVHVKVYPNNQYYAFGINEKLWQQENQLIN